MAIFQTAVKASLERDARLDVCAMIHVILATQRLDSVQVAVRLDLWASTVVWKYVSTLIKSKTSMLGIWCCSDLAVT